MAGRAETAARRRAREARVRRDAERARRDEQIEQAATAFFLHQDEAHELELKLSAVRGRMAEAVHKLATLGESQRSTADLLGVDVAEVRALLSLVEARTPAGDPDVIESADSDE